MRFVRTLLALLVIMAATVTAQNSKKNGLSGWDYFKQKRYVEALELLEKDNRLYPKSHEVMDGVGWCHYFLGRLDEAESWFRRALAISPDYNYSKMGVESVAAARQGPLVAAENLLDAGRYAEALAAFEDLVLADATAVAEVQIRVHRGRGYAYWGTGRFNEALKDFTKVLRIKDDDGAALAGIGYVQFARKKWSEAELALQKAVDLLPDQVIPRLTWAACAFERGKNDEALARYRRTTELFPRSYGAWIGVGLCHAKAGDEVSALEAFRKALALSSAAMTEPVVAWIKQDPKRQVLHVDQAFALIAAGQPAAAREILRGLPATIDPQGKAFADALASLHLGDEIGALATARSLLDRDADPVRSIAATIEDPARGNLAMVQVSASSICGWASQKLGDDESAEAYFERARSLPGDWPDALTGIGWVRLAQKRWVDAEAVFDEVANQLPGYAPIRNGMAQIRAWRFADYDRAWTLIGQGEFDRAVPILESLRGDKSGRFPVSRLDLVDWSLGEIARRRDDPATAERHYAAALAANAENGDALVGLGWAKQKLEKFGEAGELLERAIAGRPFDPEPCRILARVLIAEGRLDIAVQRLDEWTKRFPVDADLAFELGACLNTKERWVESRIAYGVGLSQEPDRLTAAQLESLFAREEYMPLHGILGWAFFGRSRWNDALPQFLAARKGEPGEISHAKGLALTLGALGRIDEAVKAGDEYLAGLGKSQADAAERRAMNMALGWNAYTAQQLKPALDLFQRIEKDEAAAPGADLLNALGWTWLGMDKGLKARDYFLRALALVPRMESALSGLEAVNRSLLK